MHERLFAFHTKQKYIYNLQFGFRTGYSTNHALLDLTEDIRKVIDDNKIAVGGLHRFYKRHSTLLTTPPF